MLEQDYTRKRNQDSLSKSFAGNRCKEREKMLRTEKKAAERMKISAAFRYECMKNKSPMSFTLRLRPGHRQE
jgi:hypothetical protein